VPIQENRWTDKVFVEYHNSLLYYNRWFKSTRRHGWSEQTHFFSTRGDEDGLYTGTKAGN
jgi:hypothetical protein